MSRYYDGRSLGRSTIAPFIPGESASDRHSRRLRANIDIRARLDAWLTLEDLSAVISNEGHHWRILRSDGRVFAQWWPSSAKLVFGAEFSKSVHCHDVDILRRALSRRLNQEKGARPAKTG